MRSGSARTSAASGVQLLFLILFMIVLAQEGQEGLGGLWAGLGALGRQDLSL